MKRRISGAVPIGLGAVFVVLAVGSPLYLAPAVTKLPYSLEACPKPPARQPSGCLKASVAEAVGARFLQISTAGIDVNTADLRSTTEVVPQPKLTAEEQKAGRLNDNTVVWDVYQTTERTDTGDVVGASSTELALDRLTAAGVSWTGQWLDDSGRKDSTIEYSGQIYKFPFHTEKRDYKFFDSELRAAGTAKFVSVESIEGLRAYHFVQVIPPTPLDVEKGSLAILLARFAPAATSGTVVYSNTREVWVDPVTGAFVKVREQQHKELQPDVGATQVLLDGDFVYTHETIVNSVKSARDNGRQLALITLYAPIGFGVLGLVLFVVGLVVSRRSGPESTGDGSRPVPVAGAGWA